MKVKFINVGRDRKSWDADMDAVTHRTLIRQIQKHRALASQDVEFVFASDLRSGTIIVGGVRPVGTFFVENGVVLPNISIDTERGTA